MHALSGLTLALALAASAAAAPAPENRRGVAIERVLCYTSQVPQHYGPHYTQWQHVTDTHCTTTHVVTTTVTPLPQTTTSTVTSTSTFVAATTTGTDTSTAITTTTVMTTTGTTTTTTETQSTASSTTSLRPSSFQPVDQTVPGATHDQTTATKKKKAKRARQPSGAEIFARSGGGRSTSAEQQYVPGNVLCVEHCKSCAATTVTVTQTHGHATTVTATTTSTAVVTSYPGATTTVTITDTAATTSVVTTTDTATTTTTTYTTTVTSYDACATDNIAVYIDNLTIDGADGRGTPTSGDGSSAYACCVSALLNPLGGLWLLRGPGTCFVYTTNACTDGQASDGNYNSLGYSPGGDFSAGNALCGIWNAASYTDD